MKGRHAFHWLGIVCILLLGGGCSVVSLAYDYADWILLWKIDAYFDLSPQQEQYLEDQVVELHHWHRTSELPLYAGFLGQIEQDVQSGLTPNKLDRSLAQYQELRSHLAQRLAFHGTPFLTTLHSEQQRFFQTVLSEENQDLKKELGTTPEERLQNRIKKVMNLLEFWVGEVDSRQIPVIQRLMEKFPDTTEEYLTYREYRQRQFLEILNLQTTPTHIEKAVSDWMKSSGQDVPKDIYEGIEKWQNAVKDVMLDLDGMITVSQRAYLVDKLQTIRHTLASLTQT